MSAAGDPGGTGGPGEAGELFIQYCAEQNNIDPVTQIPAVDIKMKMYRISDFDQKAGSFNVTFVLMMDWEDPSIELAKTDDKGRKNPDFSKHFWPKVEIINCTSESPEQKGKPKYKPDKSSMFGGSIHRATTTQKYQCVLFVRPNYADFPFDTQILEISLKLSGIRLPGEKRGTRPEVRSPKRWRWEKGHEINADADFLPEFSIVRMVGKGYSSQDGPFDAKGQELEWKGPVTAKNYKDQYTTQIIISRNSTSVLWNMCFSLFVIDCLVFSAHGIPIGSLEDRMSVNLTLLLTAMAFKWVLSDKLPDGENLCFSANPIVFCFLIFSPLIFLYFDLFFSVPYLTTMEMYAIMTFMMLFLQGMVFWALAELNFYRCENDAQYVDWITGEIESNIVGTSDANATTIGLSEDATQAAATTTHSSSTNLLFDVSCQDIHVADRCMLLCELLLMISKNIWFVARVLHRNIDRLRKATDFIDVTALDKDHTRLTKPVSWQAKRNGGGGGGGGGGGSKVAPAAAAAAAECKV